ncbi:MAG: hypothetical protein J1F35_08270 [Erysipelotrichales bacterium]|nr:hypothetical protein [Erysipelotrichales bacterium]
MNIEDFKTEFVDEFLDAQGARDCARINYHKRNKELYLKVWNEGIAPAIVKGKCYCKYPQSYIDDIGQRQDIKDYFEGLGYVIKCESANYVEIYW